MKSLFHPVSERVALADLSMLPHRLKASTFINRSGTERRNLRAQANQNLRWYQLFINMNRRACR